MKQQRPVLQFLAICALMAVASSANAQNWDGSWKIWRGRFTDNTNGGEGTYHSMAIDGNGRVYMTSHNGMMYLEDSYWNLFRGLGNQDLYMGEQTQCNGVEEEGDPATGDWGLKSGYECEEIWQNHRQRFALPFLVHQGGPVGLGPEGNLYVAAIEAGKFSIIYNPTTSIPGMWNSNGSPSFIRSFSHPNNEELTGGTTEADFLPHYSSYAAGTPMAWADEGNPVGILGNFDWNSSGTGYFSSNGDGVVRFRNGQMSFFNRMGRTDPPSHKDIKLPTNSIARVLVDSDNNIWVGGKRKGVSMISANEQSIVTYEAELVDPAKAGNQDDVVEAITEDGEGNIWCAVGTATFGYGVAVYHRKAAEPYWEFHSKESTNDTIPTTGITTLFTDSRGNVWVAGTSGSGTGVAYYTPDGHWMIPDIQIRNVHIKSIVEDVPNGRMYFMGGGFVARYGDVWTDPDPVVEVNFGGGRIPPKQLDFRYYGTPNQFDIDLSGFVAYEVALRADGPQGNSVEEICSDIYNGRLYDGNLCSAVYPGTLVASMTIAPSAEGFQEFGFLNSDTTGLLGKATFSGRTGWIPRIYFQPHIAGVRTATLVIETNDTNGDDVYHEVSLIAEGTAFSSPAIGAPIPQTVGGGWALEYSVGASDPLGRSTAISLDAAPGWLSLDGDVLSGTSPVVVTNDTVTVTLTVTTTPDNATSSRTYTIIVKPNATPSWSAVTPAGATEDLAYTVSVSSSDTDGDALTISADGPDWLVLTDNHDGTGTLAGTPLAPATDSVFVSVTDGGYVVIDTLVITTANTADSPVFSEASEADRLVAVGDLLTLIVHATDADTVVGDSLTFTADLSGLPEGNTAAFDSSTQTLTWTPVVGEEGSYVAVFVAADTAGATDTAKVNIGVGAVNFAPGFINASKQPVFGTEFAELTFTLVATDVNGDSVNYGAVDLPPGAQLDPVSGAFTWTPDTLDAGEYNVTFIAHEVSTNELLADSAVVVVTIANVNLAPKIDVYTAHGWGDYVPGTDQADVDSIYADSLSTGVFAAFDYDNDSLAWDFSGLPVGATPVAREVELTTEGIKVIGYAIEWTPNSADEGTHIFDIIVNEFGSTELYSDTISVTLVVELPVGIMGGVPLVTELGQNLPNPFNPTTTIPYSLSSAGRVRLVIYNMMGQEVLTVMDAVQPAGHYFMRWNGTTRSGQTAASGIYWYRLITDEVNQIRRMTFMR